MPLQLFSKKYKNNDKDHTSQRLSSHMGINRRLQTKINFIRFLRYIVTSHANVSCYIYNTKINNKVIKLYKLTVIKKMNLMTKLDIKTCN